MTILHGVRGFDNYFMMGKKSCTKIPRLETWLKLKIKIKKPS
jgi:hypothetical protein